jgi:hypothetical protein
VSHAPETICNDGFCDVCWIPTEWEVRLYHEDPFQRPQGTFTDYPSALTFRDEASGRFIDVSRREPSDAMRLALEQARARNAARWGGGPPHDESQCYTSEIARYYGVSGELV